jgi:DNA-binding transcriptional LysR family regulator
VSLSSQHLDALMECAKTGLLTEAAKNLFVTQSALSQRILALEEELGTAVLLRSRTGVVLTAAGQELLQYCLVKRELEIETLSKIQNKSKNQAQSTLRIAGFSSVLSSIVLPSLQKFFLKFPKIRFEMKSFELWELKTLVKQGMFDFVVSDTITPEPGLKAILLGHEKNVLVESSNIPCENFYLDHDKYDRITQEYFRNESIQNLQVRYLGDIWGILQGVKSGLGRAVVPKHLIVNHKEFRVLNPKTELKVPVALHYSEQLERIEFFAEAIEHLKIGFKSILK